MQTIEIPINEYERMKEEIALLKDSDFLKKLNRLIDLLYQDRYGLYMKEYTGDLTEASIKDFYLNEPSCWDNL